MLENWWSNAQEKRTLLVADSAYWPILLRAKERHPSWNGKLLAPEQFLDLVTFRYAADPIPVLLKAGLDYSRAKTWARLLRVAFDSAHPKVEKYRAAVQCVLTRDPYAETELKRCKIVFFELKEDLELHGLCRKKGLEFDDVGFEDLGVEKHFDEEKEVLPVFSYRTKTDQYLSVFALVRERLLADASLGTRIALHVDEGGDEFYLRFASHLFDLPLFRRLETPLRANPVLASLLMGFYRKKELRLDEEEAATPEGKTMAEILSYYDLPSLPFEQGYVDLEEILLSKREQIQKGERGLMVFNNFSFDPDAEVYLLDFRFDRFYKQHADKSVLSDAELLAIGANPSYVSTLLDARKKRNFLRYQRVRFLSTVREHLSDKIYPSPFLKEFAEKNPAWAKAVVKRDVDASGVFTGKAMEFARAHVLDRALCRAQRGEYRSYDPSFQGLGPGETLTIPSWSISTIESYAACPFAFLMKRLLPSAQQDWHFAALGTMFHKVFEKAYEPGFDFESAYRDGTELYRGEAQRRGCALGGQEETYLLVYKEILRAVLAPIRAMKSSMTYHHSLSEEVVFLTLKDDRGSYPFTGRIDKLIFVGKPGNGYYYIGDYKTSKTAFIPGEVPYGASLQLPLYHYALAQDERNEDIKKGFSFGGFGIQRIDFSSLRQAAGKDGSFLSSSALYKNMMFRGFGLDDIDLWRNLDRTRLKEEKKGVSLKKGSFFEASYHAGNPDEGEPFDLFGKKTTLEELERVAVDACLGVIHAIERGEFPIAPTSSPRHAPVKGATLSCSYCPYRDICYSKGAASARQGHLYAEKKGGRDGI